MTVTTPAYLVVATMQRRSGIERDAIQNTYHYAAPSANPTLSDFNNWCVAFGNFMAAISPHLSPVISHAGNALKQDFYKIPPEKALLGPPHHSQLGTIAGASTGGPLPSEVALVLSLDGTTTQDAEHGPGGTRPAQRKRNRVYLGPLSSLTLCTVQDTEESQPTNAVIDDIGQAYEQHMVTEMISYNWIPMLFSKVAWALWPLLRAWIDNAWDSQRRRGNDRTIKTDVPLPQATSAGFRALGLEPPPGLAVV